MHMTGTLLLASERLQLPIGDVPPLLLAAGLVAAAFVVGQVSRRWISEVIAFMAIGIVVGPEFLGLIDAQGLTALDSVLSLALGTIVFGIGERLELPRLREVRHTLVPIAVAETLATFGLVLVGLLLAGVGVSTAYLLAAIALSTSPTTLVAVITERRARGKLTEHLLAATALNNVMSALLYGLGLPVVLAARSTSGAQQGALAFVQLVVASLLIGGVGAFLLRRYMDRMHRAGERLLFVLVIVVSLVAVSRAVGAPVVVTTLVAGALAANDPRDTRPLFEALRTLEAPIFLVFFVVAGAGVHLDELASVGTLGAVFIGARFVGKVAGGWIGADLTRSGRRWGWGPTVGGGLMPFAGMAIGLAAFTLERASAAGLDTLGGEVSAVVLGSVVVFELLGPLTVRRALDRASETGRDRSEEEAIPADAPHLIRHILVPISSAEMARRKSSQIVDLAASTGATLTGLHVVPPGSEVDPTEGAPALSLVGQLAALRHVTFQPVVREHESLVDAIVEEARRAAVDLVVMGEPVPGPLDHGAARRLVHEVAARLDAGVRVLVVPTPVTPPASGKAGRDTRTARPG